MDSGALVEPISPTAFMAWLSALPARRQTCLECGAGAAEVTAFMAHQFGHAIALDVEPRHLRSLQKPAQALCGVAAALPFADNSMDLVVSLQALHHFAVADHLREAKRVLRQGGTFAALCWGEMHLPAAIAPAYDNVFQALLPYWEAAREWVVQGYAGLAFEGEAVALPAAQMIRNLSPDALDLTIARWSATQRALARGADIPSPALTPRQRRRLLPIPVSWPLLGRVFRV